MKIVQPTPPWSMTRSSIRAGINKLLQFRSPLSAREVYFVVFLPWSYALSDQLRDADDKERGGPETFYLTREHGWEGPYHWEIVIFDAITHEPLAKFESKPTD